ncbi:MAG TPA: MMPL family transporter, partial [Flavobacteriales bacterium]|nr:MMPL family transporter [Flavobacteriales bacterium]
MSDDASRLARWLSRRNARWVLIAIGIVSLFFAVALRNARLDYDFEKFFPRNDPELDRYLAFRERFGSDNDFLLLGIERSEGVFNSAFLTRVDSLSVQLLRVPDVSSVTSPTRLSEPVITPIGVFDTPYLRFANDSLLPIDSARIWNDPRVREHFFDAKAKALMVVLVTKPDLSKKRSDALLEQVEERVAASGLAQVHIGGRVHGQHYYIVMMVRELFTFLTASVLLLAVFLWFGFRSWWGVLVPIGTVGLAILWQVGFMTLVGKPLSILTMLLPTILFVVGMSDVVHILECYLDELRAGHPRIKALARTYHDVGLPTFLTALTSAIGFATLGTASIAPLQEFGFYTGIGVLLAFIIAFTLLPALLVFVGPRKLLPKNDRPSPWDRRLPRLFLWTIRHRVGILVGFGAITVIGLVLMTRIKVNNYLLEDWPDDDAQKVGYRFFEERLGGARPFEMEIIVSDSTRSVWDLDVLRRIERVQHYAEDTYGVHSIVSPVTVMYSLNKAFNGGNGSYYRLPDDDADCKRLARQAR